MADFDSLRRALRVADAEAANAREAARAAALAGDDEEARAAARRAAAVRGAALDAFADVGDPRRAAAELDDGFPILLLPVRLETRFRTARDAAGAENHELLLRIYPDDCATDAFDPALSTAETDAATRFWRETWRAGGVEAEARAAWKALAGAYGSGRAGWIAAAHAPLDPAAAPTKLAGAEIVLVVAGDALPPAAARGPLATYWRTVWRAPADTAAARATLAAAIGAATVEAAIAVAPFNLDDPPPPGLDRAATGVRVAWLDLSAATGEPRAGWRRAPVAAALPERFVAILTDTTGAETTALGAPIAEPLYLGPDPEAPDDERIVPHDGRLDVPAPLAWMFDFDAAVGAGLGLRIPISPAQAAAGFDRLLVLGLRLRDDADGGRATFEALIRGHGFSRAGFELLPQGTPTNNSDDAPSAWSRRADPDLAFADRFGPEKFAPTADPLEKRDGQVLADGLGLDPAALTRVRGADGRDAIEARAMNLALAPGTLGYMAGVLMSPVFEGWLDELSQFFAGFVTGRGALPAVRIGAQPYGIVCGTAYSRIGWLGEAAGATFPHDRDLPFLRRLHAVLGRLEADWRAAAAAVARVGDGGDPHATLLSILGLHPNSAEFHIRQGKSLAELSSRAFLAVLGLPSARALAAAQRQAALALLRGFGYAGREPDILNLFFRSGQSALKGPLVEDLPPSEALPLAPATADGRSYLGWLADAARVSLDALRQQEGFLDDKAPTAILYVLAQFALCRGYQDAGDRLRAASPFFDTAAIAELRREPLSVHLDPAAVQSDSPWRRLYAADVRLTGDERISVADHLTRAMPPDLSGQIRALSVLADTPTARLERALVEHVDLLTYRLDAWRLAFPRWQLARMRAREGAARGLYLGAWGWLEALRPKPAPEPAPPLPDDLAAAFADGPPLVVDTTNGGHLHAPSLNQAVTAAILRAGSLANRVPDAPGAFSINLASERVRRARALLDGLRNGQSLGALLGYRLERALHDAAGVVELDALVFALRRAFPLTAGKLVLTADPAAGDDTAVEARNVTDGLALVQRAAAPATAAYPWGAALPPLDPAERAVVEAAVRDLADVFDALADLMLAEATHQAAQGGADRAAAALQVASDFTAPPDPGVIRTPETGFALTCRVGLELDATAAAPVGASPRALAQPALAAWLAAALPPPTKIACRAAWTPAGGPEQTRTVTLADLGLAPIDALALLADPGGAGSGELDDRVRRHVVLTDAPRPDAPVALRYMQAGPGQLSVFAASALARRLRGLTDARPLAAGDVALPGAAAAVAAVDHVVDRARVADPLAALVALRDQLDADCAAVAPLLADPVANRAALLAGLDARLALAVERLAAASAFGGARIGWSALYDRRAERFAAMLARVAALADKWTGRLAHADAALADEAALPAAAPDADRVALLRAAEREVSTTLAPDLAPDPLRLAVTAERTAFAAKLATTRADVLDAPDPGLVDRLARCEAILPVTDLDPDPLDFTDIGDSLAAFATDVEALLASLRTDLDTRASAATAALATHDAAATGRDRLKALETAATAIFGEGFRPIPTFTLPAASGVEQMAAEAHFASGALLAHAAAVADDPDPLETWLHGAARVRPKLHQLEEAASLWDAHALVPGALSAIQLPHRPGAPWLALDFPKAAAPDGERLAYVAFGPPGRAPDGPRAGLLLDDWAETIPAVAPDEPGPQHETGVAFHFDRPSQEPPQAMLLLTPAAWSGRWSWPEIVQGVIETIELARLRAVEPAALDAGPLAQFLPATVASVTTSGLSISANFAFANLDVRLTRDPQWPN